MSGTLRPPAPSAPITRLIHDPCLTPRSTNKHFISSRNISAYSTFLSSFPSITKMSVNDQRSLDPAEDRRIPEYYRSLGNAELSQKIQNLDERHVFLDFHNRASQINNRNFVVDFGEEEAWCGLDLSAGELKALLNAERPPELNTRWINICLPYLQKDLIGVLGKSYDFSPRLHGMMKSDPVGISSKKPASKHSSNILRRGNHYFHRPRLHGTHQAEMNGSHQPDKNSNSVELEFLPQHDGRELSHYRLIDEVWHWSSWDEGRRYLCIGYNSLHNLYGSGSSSASNRDSKGRNEDLPDGKRVWSWLLICEDKTVISIHEDPYPHAPVDEDGNKKLDLIDHRGLLSIRRNLLNVIRNLSKAHESSHDPAIAMLPIRRRVGDSEEETAHRPSDAPGLLFYVLFDDFFTTYSLVARREHKYAAALNELREAMMQKAELGHVDRLHHIGRQLSVLKNMYTSYDVIIDRVLEKQETTLASLKNSRVLQQAATTPAYPIVYGDGDDDDTLDDLAQSQFSARSAATRASNANASRGPPLIPTDASLLGVALSSAARARFKRLQYRTRLYALAEIESCLSQKESLVMMNFNLIAIKESLSVERLTRVTLLLAKATLLFMPVSLMAAYFSCQFDGVVFTPKQFWIAFAVVVVVSALALLAFSVVSGTMEGKMLVRSAKGCVTGRIGRMYLCETD
ncbi:hypothetical protein JOL62DRAFT_7767 [Phyllosticta paracitricarpa]|uniref:ADP-ribosylation factor n=1 Tax=Phyllosticta paracitricarpa TaxID=2016321 RepID=A0ABR1NJW5_9PEZI